MDSILAKYPRLRLNIAYFFFATDHTDLAPDLKDLLKPESNIMKFAKRFTKYPMKCEGLDIFSFVFIKSV